MTRRLAALTPYAIAPPRHGPQIRVAGVLGHLGPGWEVVHFSQALQRSDLPWPSRRADAGPRWVEHKLLDPLSNAWLIGLTKLAHLPAVYADRLLGLAPRRPIRAALRSADVVFVSPHYQYRWVRAHTPPGVPIVVDCHMIEADVWPPPTGRFARRLHAEIGAGELEAWRGADCVFATCQAEADHIRSAGAREVIVVPNAADVERIAPVVSANERARERRSLGLPPDAPLAIFTGSSGWANVEAADVISAQAEELRRAGVETIVVGRVGIGREPVPGVRWVGEVPDVAPWLRAADIALCPLLNGSGTSLKTVEYLAAGLPLVTTPVGVRGLSVTDRREALVTPADGFPAAVKELIDDPGLRARLAAAARAHAVAEFSWSMAGATAADTFVRLTDSQRPVRAAVPAR